MAKSRYGDLGVDARKEGIEAFRDAVSGLYRHSFCDIHPDQNYPGYGFVHHTDGAGSKPVQNYLNWKVTGDINAFRGIAQDVLSMNIGDSLCMGIPISGSFVDYVALNKFKVPKIEVLKILAEEFTGLFEMLREHEINITFAGGETADLPDQLKTLDVSGAVYTRYELDSVVTGEAIKPGDSIVGIASGGQAEYEERPSGAIMCNGITLARHSLMRPEVGLKYPEIMEPGKGYTGPFSPTDTAEGIEGTIGEEIARPTRIFAPIFKAVLEEFGGSIHGIVFNTGGGHTKCMRVGSGIRYVKSIFHEMPPIFDMIKEYGKVPWREMYVDFNMGVGAEMYTDRLHNTDVAEFIQDEFDVDAWVIGECTKARGTNKLRLETPHGNFNFEKK